MGVSWRDEEKKKASIRPGCPCEACVAKRGSSDGPLEDRKQVQHAFFSKKGHFPTKAQLKDQKRMI